MKFQSDVAGSVDRHPLLQGGRQHRHAHRQPVDRGRDAARAGDVHRRDGLRLADGRRSPPRWRITAGTTYVAAYFAPNGHYSVAPGWASPRVDNPPLHAIPNATSPNGVYAYVFVSSFPTSSFNASNYLVDVMFRAGS